MDIMQEFVKEMEATMTPYEMVFCRWDEEHVPHATHLTEQASGWFTPWLNEHTTYEEYYRWRVMTFMVIDNTLLEWFAKSKILDANFYYHKDEHGRYVDQTLTEHYWQVFRDLTEDETEDDYNTPHVPIIESRWEIASGWFDHIDRHEPNPIAMECKDQIWREIYLFTAHYETMCYVADQF